MIDLEPAAREVARLLDGVTDDRLDDPTPCDGAPVASLLDHFVGLSLAFAYGARKATMENPPKPGMPPAGNLDPEWRTVLPRRLDELVAAWRDPAAWEGTTQVGGARMPAEQMGVVALGELVLHGWDLARATGQPFTCDPASTAVILALAGASVEAGAARDGLFGPPVPVPDDAPDLDRALGFAGRDPAWTP